MILLFFRGRRDQEGEKFCCPPSKNNKIILSQQVKLGTDSLLWAPILNFIQVYNTVWTWHTLKIFNFADKWVLSIVSCRFFKNPIHTVKFKRYYQFEWNLIYLKHDFVIFQREGDQEGWSHPASWEARLPRGTPPLLIPPLKNNKIIL